MKTSQVSYLGAVLQAIRGSASLYEVEQHTGISRGAMSRYERGLRMPERDVLFKLAAYYGIEYKVLRKAWLDDMFPEKAEQAIILEWASEKSGRMLS